jgi:hypothetical protein
MTDVAANACGATSVTKRVKSPKKKLGTIIIKIFNKKRIKK